VRLHLFDALYVDGRPIDRPPYEERWAALELLPGTCPSCRASSRLLARRGPGLCRGRPRPTGTRASWPRPWAVAYNPGVRGKAWLKLKHVHSLDLVIVAAEWGYGRRHGWLSNYHLAARTRPAATTVVVGKTFKGLTDAQFQEMTERLLSLERSRRGNVVFVQPSVVVEVLFNEVQGSRLYPSGLALRFARIAHLREDKPVEEVDSIGTLRRLYEQQFEFKGRLKAG
jgi:DNA ligase 1